MSSYSKWYHPYKPATKFNQKVAYFSMEFGIDQALKTYSGGLGFLAGSHMRSAFENKQNLVGVGMLWKYGYYDQGRHADQTLLPHFVEKKYSYLDDPGITVKINIHGNDNVHVKAYCLKPETFGTVPIYFLTTDLPENDHLSRTITDKLYDANEMTRIAQSIVLGAGGAKVIEAIGGADIYHLNEGHGLPAFFYLKDKGYTKKNFVFTTHTPEKAGNEEKDIYLLNRMGFFSKQLTEEQMMKLTDNSGVLNYTVAAGRLSKITNGVSKLHGKVSKDMWKSFNGMSKIISITNSQNQKYWQDKKIMSFAEKGDIKNLQKRKNELKAELIEEVANQTGKMLDPEVLTIVWARRFAGYKRADLLLRDRNEFNELVRNTKSPVQIVWAGKPYPFDNDAIDTFNYLIQETKNLPNCAILTGYELSLSRVLKNGADIWLNNPRITREASGTSGMTAAMNGAVNLSTDDGWIPEFAKNKKNAFVLPALDHKLPHVTQDDLDAQNLYKILKNDVLPLYYGKSAKWWEIVSKSVNDVIHEFESGRMAKEYYELMYSS